MSPLRVLSLLPVLALPLASPHLAQRPLLAADGTPPISGVVAQWIADEEPDVGISGLVERWIDATGNGLDLIQGQGQSKPWRNYFDADGYAALNFDGSDFVFRTDILPTGGHSRALAFRVDDLQLGGILMGAAGGNALRFLPGNPRLVFEQGGDLIFANTPVVLGTWNTVVASYDDVSGEAILYLNGVEVANGFLPAATDDDIVIGATKLGGYALRGAVADAMLVDHALDATELAQVEQYLSRYLGNLHPVLHIDGLPKDGQLYPRDDSNQALVQLSGMVETSGFELIRMQILRNGLVYKTATQALSYGDDAAPFTVSETIAAGLHDYEMRVSLVAGTETTVVARRDHIICGDAFIIDGQSNSVGKDWHQEGKGDVSESVWIRSFGNAQYVVGFGPPPLVDKAAHNNDMHWDIADALKPHLHATIGQWAVRMAEHFVVEQGVPVAIINGGVEASEIMTHQRNDANPLDPSGIYGRLLQRVLESGINTRVRALFYYQGESDGDKPEIWRQGFANLVEDWMVDFPTLEHIYCFQIREGCNLFNEGVREIQRTLGEVHPEVTVMSTTDVPTHDICHYYYVGYREIGDRIARLVSRDLYGVEGTDIEPPNPLLAQWTTAEQNELLLTFGPIGDTISVDPDVANHFAVNDGTDVVSVVVTGQSQLTVTLAGSSTATAITWRGHQYDGPWITNANGVGGLTFFDFPILK
ncbi:MAG: sialate O-acetylesterase [Planctomycetota bacterium]